jgi:pimeloyl-ACP methyl ester carboxylesterase
MIKKLLLTVAGVMLIGFTYSQTIQRPNFLKKDSIQSTLDKNTQVFYFDKSTSSKAKPLVVELHSWSNTADSQKDILAEQAHIKNWNYILPNFRGVNNHLKACCSEFVISDIDEAIDWALQHMNVDKKNIYIIGNSGGGYATMAMYMKSRHNIRAFSAWSSISDLATWHEESLERKNKYADEIIQCTNANGVLDDQKARERSPLFWEMPIKKRRNSILQIYAGIHDGYTGSVPISQSIKFYNKLLIDTDETDDARYVSPDDVSTMLKTQSFPLKKPIKKIDNRAILYQKSSKKITITIFEGTHEILKNVALDLIGN